MNKLQKNTNHLFKQIVGLIETAQGKVATTANLAMVYTYFEIGRMIVDEEQRGKKRAQYGQAILQELSRRLTEQFGDGYSYANLRNMRQFYLLYDEPIMTPCKVIETKIETKTESARQCLADSKPAKKSRNAARNPRKSSSTESDRHCLAISNNHKNHAIITPILSTPPRQFCLSWSHYLQIMRLENSSARKFYEIEATQEQWSVRTLARQIASSLYERLALSRKKKDVLRLAREGQTIQHPCDIIKEPMVLEFLGLERKTIYSETNLENAIIDKIQFFLLELGKGFLFEARQRRFSFDEQHFFVDLVFYNRLLQCYVLFDLKVDKLTHQDLGQMQMYVNFFDRHVKLPHEKPTIGIVLCKEKNNALVELTLPKNANIYASEYKLYLPSAKTLQKKLQEWLNEFDRKKNNINGKK